jgi:hypothetical protein
LAIGEPAVTKSQIAGWLPWDVSVEFFIESTLT